MAQWRPIAQVNDWPRSCHSLVALTRNASRRALLADEASSCDSVPKAPSSSLIQLGVSPCEVSVTAEVEEVENYPGHGSLIANFESSTGHPSHLEVALEPKSTFSTSVVT